jgi:hypothetical protein
MRLIMNTEAPGEHSGLLLNIDAPADPTWKMMAADPKDTDGTDGDGDGTDGDGDGTDGTDGDGTDGDGDGTDGTDGDGTDGSH